jgi:hypothetical protein
MPLSNIQERVERSVYEAIRKTLVDSGYLPDISTFPNTEEGQADYDTEMDAVQVAKGFAAEVFGHGSSLSKENKRTPRIAIIPRRIMPGEVGPSIAGQYSPDPSNPDQIRKLKPAIQASNLHLDINIASSSSAQDRVLHSILASALGTWSYVPMYDDPTDLFFIRQFNFYDLPDDRNGIEEKVYSYEIPELYINEGEYSNVATIKEIKVYTWTTQEKHFPARPVTVPVYPNQVEGILIDLSGLSFNLQ